MNKVDNARSELAAAEKEIPEASKDFSGVVSFDRFTGDQLNELRGELQLHSYRHDSLKQADELLSKTADSVASHRGADALAELYLLEHIARIAREQQQWELAKHSAELMMTFDPSYFGAHYAAALIAEHHGDSARQHKEMAAAQQLWSHADPNLRELAQVSSDTPGHH
jgi:hypothetical protein